MDLEVDFEEDVEVDAEETPQQSTGNEEAEVSFRQPTRFVISLSRVGG